MTTAQQIEAQIEANHNRRMANEARIDWSAYDRRSDTAESLIGELVREGATLFYINCRNRAGALTGKTREFGSRFSAKVFLIRNNYV